MYYRHHCEVADETFNANPVGLRDIGDTENPVKMVASHNDTESVNCRESEESKESVGSEQSVEYKPSMDHEDTNGIEGMPFTPSFDFGFDLGKFDFGFEESISWFPQPKSIVV